MSKAEFAEIIGVLTAGIGREWPQQQVQVWYECLKDLDPGDLRSAVLRWLSEADSGFPAIAALRRMATEARAGRLPSSAEAWERVTAAVRRHGSYDKAGGMASLEPLERAAVDAAGGWGWICDVTTENRQAMAAQFRRAYESLAERHAADRALPAPLRPRLAVSEATRRVAGSIGAE